MSDAWKSAGDGPIWLPALNAAEQRLSIPSDLLARMAYQESSFRAGIITGAIPSSVGALGLMQLMPQFFQSVNVPKPFTAGDTQAQINESANFLAGLWRRFSDWQVAVAAYNWGGGSVHHEYVIDHNRYVLADMPDQTQSYIRNVFTDVPIQGALFP
jgi:soluble lytic murein transglycosylase-like protein